MRKILFMTAAVISIILSLIITVILLWSYRPHIMKGGLEALLSSSEYQVRISNIYWHGEDLYLSDISITDQKQEKIFNSPALILRTSLKEALYKLTIAGEIRLEDAVLYNQPLVLSLRFKRSFHALSVNDAKFIFGANNFIANLQYKMRGGKLQNIRSNGEIGHLSVELINEVGKFLPQPGFCDFVKDYILTGDIKGQWKISLDKAFFRDGKFTKGSILGEFNLEKVGIKYLPNYPVVQVARASAKMEDLLLHFDILEGNSSKLNLLTSTVEVDLDEHGKNNTSIKVHCNGPASELALFIPTEALQDLKHSEIDFTKTKGRVDGEIDINIPFDDKPIEYDIKAEIKDLGLSVFRDHVDLRNGNIKGYFDGSKIKIEGNCLVNEFKSTISYLMNLEDNQQFDHELALNILFEARQQKPNDLLAVHLGSAPFSVNYKKKGKKVYINTFSDLSNISFSVDKIDLHKKAMKKAKLYITNDDNHIDLYQLNLIGDDNLAIEAYMSIMHGSYILQFNKVKFNDTDFVGKVEILDDKVIAKIKGNSLNLSNIALNDLTGTGDNKQGNRTTDIEIDLKKMIMHNDIIFDNVKIDIECNKHRCQKGNVYADVGTRKIAAKLINEPNIDRWVVESTNAGAVFNALDIYEKILAGDMVININSHLGKQTYIDGDFVLDKFVSIDMPFLTKLVTITSFPGLISAITDNNNVQFRSMKGKITYQDGVMRLSNCRADGPYFDFTMDLKVDNAKRKIIMKGNISPSFFGVSEAIRAIPIIGRVMSYKNQSIVGAPYVLEFNY